MKLHLEIHGIHIDVAHGIGSLAALSNEGERAPGKNPHAENDTDDTGQNKLILFPFHKKSRDRYNRSLEHCPTSAFFIHSAKI